MNLKKTLYGLVVGAMILGNSSQILKAERDPIYSNDEERDALLRSDLQTLLKQAYNNKESELELTVYAKDADGYFFGLAYKPGFLHDKCPSIVCDHTRLYYARLFDANTDAIGIDWYTNAYVPFLPQSPLIQAGLGISYFDKQLQNLASQVNFHLFFKVGFINNDGFYASYGVDHWSNAGVWGNVKNNQGINVASIAIGKKF